MVTSRWIYKIKLVVDCSIEKYKAQFVLVVFLRKREWIMMGHSLPWLGIPPLELLFSCFYIGLETSLDGCEDYIPQWHN